MPTSSAVSDLISSTSLLSSHTYIFSTNLLSIFHFNVVFFFSVDHSRVQLKPFEGCENDYINANFIDVRLFLVT